MKNLLCILVCACSSSAFSQIDMNISDRVPKRSIIRSDKLFELKKNNRIAPASRLQPDTVSPYKLNYDRNVLTTMQYSHHARIGFDVYTSPNYRMAVLVPDSANNASLRMKILKTPLLPDRPSSAGK